MSRDYQSILLQAVSAVDNSTTPPAAAVVVEALLQAEKAAKKNRVSYDFNHLIGSWRLYLITGTKKTQQKIGVVLDTARYLPRWLKIQLTYCPTLLTTPEQAVTGGTVENLVELAGAQLVLKGPVQFLPPKNILTFDFTQMTIQWSKLKLYQGYIRGGKSKEAAFYCEKIGKRAFFSFFLVEEQMLAARGRGGGLALWIRR